MDFINNLPGKEYRCGNTLIYFPNKNDFDSFQRGFRDDGITKDSYISTEKGSWQPNWYVIAINSLAGNPYFIDINDNKIYFVGHDFDWAEDVEKIVDSLDSFLKIMEVIDNNLNDVYGDKFDLEEKTNMVNNTLLEIKKVDLSINEKHFKELFEICSGIY